MAKSNGNMTYTSLAKGMPNAGKSGGIDNHKVVGGQPGGGGSDSKGGSTKNMGKMKGSY